MLVIDKDYKINELVYEDRKFIIYRGERLSDRQLVRIELTRTNYLSSDRLVLLQNQYSVMKSIDLRHILKVISFKSYKNDFVLILEDFGESTLQDFFRPLDPQSLNSDNLDDFLRTFLPISIQLAEILGELYIHGIIHRDIKPANFQIDSQTQQVKLTNFGHALLVSDREKFATNPNFEGTLAYASPEQTGRINRGIDYRSDFYSLGIAFYELLTGKLPFSSVDPIELIHCHLAKLPIPVSTVNPVIPPVLSAIVAKLMAKNAEDRYQSALGLKYDLECCWSQWQSLGSIEPFEIGKKSLVDRFIISKKLYGREVIVQIIFNALERIKKETTELVLLSGFFGVGKTTIIDEFHKLVAHQKVYFIKGEFNSGLAPTEESTLVQQQQYSRSNSSFIAFIQAFRSLMGQLSLEDDERLAQYKDKVLAIVGERGQVLIDRIPELEKVIGKQPPVEYLPPPDDTIRFDNLFPKLVDFLKVLDRPLVICLDDLQAIDEDSLQLLEYLMRNIKNLLMVCAYRDNEMSGIHPLMMTVNELRASGIAVTNTILSSLDETYIHELLADSFNCQIESIRPLAELVYHKTNGNPFFAIKFLKSLERDGLIKFNAELESWQCDLSKIKIQSLTNDEIDLMALQLQQLSVETQEMLKLAACLGMEFDLQTVGIITRQSEAEVAEILWSALQAGSIVPKQETYNFFPVAAESAPIERLVAVSYRFSHDRVCQAAYSLIPAAERAMFRYQIGELLLHHALVATGLPAASRNQPDRSLSEAELRAIAALDRSRLFTIVELLNHSAVMGVNPTLLRQLNTIASRQACTTKDYPAALAYAQIALQTLDPAAWQQDYRVAFDTHKLTIEVAARCGAVELLERSIELASANVQTPWELADIQIAHIQSLVARDLPTEAIAIARSLLQELDVVLLEAPTLSDVERAMQEIDDLLHDREIETLAELPITTDLQQLAIARVATSIVGICYVTEPLIYALLVTLQVQLALRHGNNSDSAYSYAAYGILINNYRQDVISASRFGSLAASLAVLPAAQNFQSATLAAIGLFLHHRTAHLRTTLPVLESGYRVGLATEKFEYAGYCIEGAFATSFWCGCNLSQLATQLVDYRHQLIDLYPREDRFSKERLSPTKILYYCDIYSEMVLVLCGNLDNRELTFDRIADEAQLFASKDLERNFIGYFHRAMLQFLIGDVAVANVDVLRAREYLSGVAGLIYEVEFYFYDSLIALANVTNRAELKQERHRISENQHRLAHWAKHAPMNHLHKWQLVAAETYRWLGNKAAAIEYYELAIAGAVAHDYLQESALANELAAKFYFDWGKDKLAIDYLQTAYDDYAHWGATAKLDKLVRDYPQLSSQRAHLQNETALDLSSGSIESDGLHPIALESSVNSAPYSNLDSNAYIKAIQALYSEIDLDRLLRTLMDVVVENAGADSAALLLNHDGNLTIALEYGDGELDTLDFDLHSFDRDYRLPLFLIRNVHRTQAIEIYHGTNNPYLASDPYFEEHHPQSILCLPILNQSKLIGILYLENSLVSGAFNADRVELLNIICTQAAISLENARLHQESQAYAQRLEQSLLDLQFSEARLHKVADNIPGAIAQICIEPERGNAVLRYISSGCYELYEVTAQEMLEGKYSLRDFEHRDDSSQIDRAIWAAREHQEPIKIENRIVTLSGKEKWIQLAASSLEPQLDGSLITECTILDITDRKQAAIELQATNEELIRSNRLKDEFLANMSHELRTPLNAILGMTEGLQEGAFGPIEPEQLTALNTIECSGTHLLALINDILELAKIEAGQLEIVCVPTNIESLCRSSLVFIKQQAFQKQLTVEVKIQPNLPLVTIDERRICQVLINLLNNAVKFTSAGGHISLEAVYLDTPDFDRDVARRDGGESSNNSIDLALRELDRRVRITVTDTGIGISPDNIKRLFKPFIQIDGALNRQFEGTGLGLALVKRLVDLHGGRVSLSSELGLGSSFSIDLPCADLPVTPTLASEESPTIELVSEPLRHQKSDRSPLILLVEDNDANISTMTSYLKAKGYQIVLARNGKEAIDCTREIVPSVILMDIQMPIMDGLSATRQIREFSDIPIIALTALATDDDRDRCFEAGVSEYFSKPVKLKQLTKTIQEYLTELN
jgi:PAS domain S-box-containing protein